MGKRTPLYDSHVAAGARIVDFGGWDMPLHYGSQVEEHHAVRREAGIFDVSHMTIVELEGERTREFLRELLANDVARLNTPGKALYSCMLQEDGGILDDLIAYYMDQRWFRLVVNAATRDKDLAWIERQARAYAVGVRERRDLAMLAVQGPAARERAAAGLAAGHREAALALKPFNAASYGDVFVARTGYTGEDGWEMILPAARAAGEWQRLLEAGCAPCGLGARDTLRLEAGLNLYGADMDETTTPLESGLAWTVAFEPADRDFIGRAALERQRAAGPARRLVGLVLEERGIARGHQPVLAGNRRLGATTSGGFSPTLERSIALARIAADHDAAVQVEIRGRAVAARIVSPPFVRNGKPQVEL